MNEKEICNATQKSTILSFLPAPSLQHPELLEPESAKLPVQNQPTEKGRITCAERIRLGEQSLNINSRVAVEMSEILTELLLTQKLKRFAVYFDLESGASRAVYNTPQSILTRANYKPKRKSK